MDTKTKQALKTMGFKFQGGQYLATKGTRWVSIKANTGGSYTVEMGERKAVQFSEVFPNAKAAVASAGILAI